MTAVEDTTGTPSAVAAAITDDEIFAGHLGGKLSVQLAAPLETQRDLSIAYTPGVAQVSRAIAADPADLKARHLLGVHELVSGDAEAGLAQFMEMLRRDRAYGDGLARKSLIDAFRILDDEDLVSKVRRQMSALLLS